jgi:hypothetical protein
LNNLKHKNNYENKNFLFKFNYIKKIFIFFQINNLKFLYSYNLSYKYYFSINQLREFFKKIKQNLFIFIKIIFFEKFRLIIFYKNF